MSRKLILTVAVALASAALISAPAFAGGGGGGGKKGGKHKHGHHHHHAYVYGGYVKPVYVRRAVSPGPCSCLTKAYTPDGTVVFTDLCTKEAATAPVNRVSAQMQVEQAPTNNFAGKSYEDYLKANPQTNEMQKN